MSADTSLYSPSPTRRQPAYADPAPYAPTRTSRRLRVVPATQPGPPVVRLVAAVITVFALGLMAMLGIHLVQAQDAYRLHDAQRATAALHAQEASLAHQVEALNDPQSIAAKAAALGMVPSTSPVFVTPTGQVLGAKVPKGTKISYPTNPSNGVVVVGKRTPATPPSTTTSSTATRSSSAATPPSAGH